MAAVSNHSKSSGAVAWWKWAGGVLMLFVIYGAFFIVRPLKGFNYDGEVARIMVFHVPVAVLCSVFFFVGSLFAALYLKNKQLSSDAKSAVSMELGFLCSVLATITGSIFAGAQWGSFWNWDPREVSIVALLLVYASYLLLRGAVAGSPERRAQLSAVYSLVTLVPATFLVWVVPRIPALQSLHPTTTLSNPKGNDPAYNLMLLLSFVAFSLIFLWVSQLRFRAMSLATRQQARLQK